jgi:hypothetical protein
MLDLRALGDSMNKIPVGQTISQTYGFAFGHYLPILGALWLPIIVLGALAYFIFLPDMANFPAILQQAAQHSAQDSHTPFMPMAMSRMTSHVYLLDIFELVVFSVIAVGVTKEALGLRTGPRFVYLSFGKPELLVMGAYFVVFVIIMVAVIAMFVVGGIVGVVAALVFAGSGAHGGSAAMALSSAGIAFLLGVLIFCAMIYFFTRLSYLIVPVSVAEGRFGIGRSWELTKGNFWRIFAIALATVLPLIVLETIFVAVAFGPALVSFAMEVQKNPDAANAHLVATMQGIYSYMIYAYVIGLLIAPVVYGLTLGQAAFAYRELVPPAAGETATH